MNAQPTEVPFFHVMTKARGAICNLNFKCCYLLRKEQLDPGSSFRMSEKLLEEFTRQHIDAQNVLEVTFARQGGEPTLMALNIYEKAIPYQEKYKKPGMRIYNTLQTNAVM